jgi:hypothetical protein
MPYSYTGSPYTYSSSDFYYLPGGVMAPSIGSSYEAVRAFQSGQLNQPVPMSYDFGYNDPQEYQPPVNVNTAVDDYDFFKSIGINPDTTSTFSNSPSNKELESKYFLDGIGGIDYSKYNTTEIPNKSSPGDEAYGWRYFSDGTAIRPDGRFYSNNPETGKHEIVYDPKKSNIPASIVNALLGYAKDRFMKKDASGKEVLDWNALLKTGAGLVGAYAGSKASENVQKVGYQGTVPKYTAVRQAVQNTYDPNRRPGSSGQRYFSDTAFAGDSSAAVTGAQTQAREQAQAFERENRENPAKQRKMAAGGLAATDAGRYLRGETDGMSDEIPSSIDGVQPAALSHGEFVVPADVVSHLGNGNSDAGAKKLYQMMDKIRVARTGTKKQGKEIDADSFMPGGLASAYASGGSVKGFSEGGSTYESNLSNWAGPAVTEMLGKGMAAADMPYQAYQGPLTAGASGLQQQAFQQAGQLGVPSSVGQAANTAGNIATSMQGLSYQPTQFQNQFQAPQAYQPMSAPSYANISAQNVGSSFQPPQAYQAMTAPTYNNLSAQNVSSTFKAPSAYQAANFTNAFRAPAESAATQFTNQYRAPAQGYQTGQFSTDTFDSQQAQKYMNPYLESALAPQLEEARRQSEISRLSDASRLTKAGAYGGSRQAIMDAENRRNLGMNMANITGQGYNTAFQNAMSQFNMDQGRMQNTQQATEQSRQFGAAQAADAAQLQAQFGLSAQQAQEMARQFNQGQSMNAAQLQAQFGLSAQQAQEASRQFGAQQSLASASTAGQLGLQAALANQQAGLSAGQANMNAALQAAQQREQSRQFGASQGLASASTAGQLGLQAALANQQAGLSAGQANMNAALQAAQQREQSRQFGASQGLASSQAMAQFGDAAQRAQEASRQFGAQFGLQGLQGGLSAAQTQGSLGAQQNQLSLANLAQLTNLGQMERGIESEGIAADLAQFREERDNPFRMAQFRQSLFGGLPLSTQGSATAGTNKPQDSAAGAAALIEQLKALGLIKE